MRSPPAPLVARVLAALAAAAALSAQASPADEHDPVLELLRSRGLLAAAEPLRQAHAAAADLAIAALSFVGVRYRRGGNSAEEGFDCSGFTRHVVASTLGLALPRRADEQARDAAAASVPRDALRPGDLVFFNTLRRAFSHVGIYIGEGRFVHAPKPGAEVRVEDMHSAYWRRRFDGARRVDAGPTP